MNIEDYRKELIAKFSVTKEVQVDLAKVESRALGELIKAWNLHKELKNKKGPVVYIKTKMAERKFKRLLINSFDDFPKVNALFRFYIYFKGREGVLIDGQNIDGNIKRIKFTSVK